MVMRPIPTAIGLSLAGLIAFFLYHWFFVAPVWAVLLEGLIWIFLHGAAVGWAYQRTVLDMDRSGPKWGFGFGALLASTMIPALIVGLVHGPFPSGASLELVLPILPLAFLGVPISLVIAWWLNGWQKIAWPFVVACLPVGIMIGGSIATFGGTVDLFLLFAALLIAGGGALAWLVDRKERALDSLTA